METLIAVYNRYGRRITYRDFELEPSWVIKLYILRQLTYEIGYMYVAEDVFGNRTIRMELGRSIEHRCILRYNTSMNLMDLLKVGYIISIDTCTDYNKIIKDMYGLNIIYNIPNAQCILSQVVSYIEDDLEFLMIMKGVSRGLRNQVIREHPILKDYAFVNASSPLIRYRLDGYKLEVILKKDMHALADMNNIEDDDVCVYNKGKSIIAHRVCVMSTENVVCMCPIQVYNDNLKHIEYEFSHIHAFEDTYLYKLNKDIVPTCELSKGDEYSIKGYLSWYYLVSVTGYSSTDEFLQCIANSTCMFDHADSYTSASDLLYDITHIDLKCLHQVILSSDADYFIEELSKKKEMDHEDIRYIIHSIDNLSESLRPELEKLGYIMPRR